MTERKPAGMSQESWIDRQIREATERGDFDDLPGKGKPLPDAGQPFDENWWLKDYLRREKVGGDGILPPSLILKRDLERLPRTVARMSSEVRVREYTAELNDRITNWLRMPHGPYVHVAPVDVDEIVEQWRTARQRPAPAANPAEPPAHARPAWWRRLFARD
ncbi:DUF1992 domain-containing protein [Nocardia sp. CDC159]|uniref:DUF1992 domain-containing protein n=1 Tax=Nocardia pulmonis TaxID=2951408 RepID=A0A9X2E3N4_9NOCA|nr:MULTISPECIES: DUF1992 domain-containing protein [Nocardia]MCM6772230.1 DUF1992 domain-containing protein [Nocardia pulmonis]MCM6785112.1 DUF1992 domain-containing protein [Nocardia sp. CDC159]